jgi:hypothetical protein
MGKFFLTKELFLTCCRLPVTGRRLRGKGRFIGNRETGKPETGDW